MTKPMKNPKLYNKVLRMIADRPREVTYRKIAAEAGVPEAWLRSFAIGRIPDPSVNRVEMLYCYFSGKELDV